MMLLTRNYFPNVIMDVGLFCGNNYLNESLATAKDLCK